MGALCYLDEYRGMQSRMNQARDDLQRLEVTSCLLKTRPVAATAKRPTTRYSSNPRALSVLRVPSGSIPFLASLDRQKNKAAPPTSRNHFQLVGKPQVHALSVIGMGAGITRIKHCRRTLSTCPVRCLHSKSPPVLVVAISMRTLCPHAQGSLPCESSSSKARRLVSPGCVSASNSTPETTVSLCGIKEPVIFGI